MKVEKEEKIITLYNDNIKESVASWVEQDIILPDTKPDAIKVITVNVNPYITSVEAASGNLKVTGRLNYFVIYKTSEKDMNVRGILTSMPYVENLSIKNINSDMNINVQPKVKNIIFALPNERKISVKTELLFNVNATNVTKVPFLQNFKQDADIQAQMKEENFNNILENKCETITSREDVMLPNENSDFGEILRITTDIINTEFKQSYNKLLIKGDILVKMLYLPENSESTIKTVKVSVPFTGMIEFSNIKDSALFDIKYSIKDFNVKPNVDITSNKTLNIDYQIAVCALMYEKETVSFVDDFYSENKELKYNSSNNRVVKSTEMVTRDIDVRDTLENVILKEYNMIDYDIDTSYLIVKDVGSNISIDGNLKVSILSQNPNTLELENKTVDVPIDEKFEIDNIDENSKVSVDIAISSASLEQQERNVNLKVVLKAYIQIDNIIDISFIEDIEMEDLDEQNLDSMSIYIVKPKDTLWSIAKKYKTTVEKIATINNIENPNLILEGQKLLIIR